MTIAKADYIEGLAKGLAVPLRNMQGRTLAALNVVGTAEQLSDSAVQRKWLPLLLEAARELRPLL